MVLTFNEEFTISGGGLPGKQYKVAQLLYHFGSTNGQGSEHALDGKLYDAEVGPDAKWSATGDLQINPLMRVDVNMRLSQLFPAETTVE